MTIHKIPGRRGIVAVRADTSTVPAALAEMKKAFEDFKAANDEKLALIEKGQEDVVKNEEVDRISARIDELKDAVEAAVAGTEDAMKSAQRLAVGGGDEAKAVAKLKADAVAFAAAKTGKPVSDPDSIDVERYEAYCAAFAMHLREGGQRGEMLPEGIRAELSSGADSEGGFWAPSEMSSRIATKQFDTSNIRPLVTVETTTADTWEMGVDVDQATSGGWVSEKGSRPETDTPRLGIQKIEVHEQYAEPHATQRILDDASRDVEAWLAGKIADILGRTENTAFINGSGVGQPRGIFSYGTDSVTTDDDSRTWGVMQYVPSGAAGAFPTVSGSTASDPDALITLIAKLKPIYRANARWMMNRATEAAIRKLKDGDGRYLVGMGDIQDGAVGFALFGYPISNAEDIADIASDAYAVALGDFRAGYTIVDRQGIRVLRDPYTSKPFVKFYTTKRVGADVVDFEAIKFLKFATS